MTFYWWSHWFWITLLGSMVLFITFAHTYPSQEISSEYNNDHMKVIKAVTRLYQAATTTVAWPATATTPSNLQDIPTSKTILKSVITTLSTPVQITNEKYLDQINDDISMSSKESEHKRSTGVSNDTNESSKKFELDSVSKMTAKVNEATMLKPSVVNNYTNFSSIVSEKSLNCNDSTALHHNSTANSSIEQTLLLNNSVNSTQASSPLMSTITASTPKMENKNSTLSWLNEILEPQQFGQSIPIVDDGTDTLSDVVAHKVPFTLENVNKEEELRRAETEHRSRKSKVLSAEYRHINRFINYSTDSKNLLARSASTAPNDLEADDSNISSEALAIQRTYFLDAGAISAICFTVFGVCCTVGTMGIVLYRRRYLNKPQALSEPDSSVYIDDSTMRDNSDEMYSLDNDSFLNSLEAMTIQNYWTDTVKHTKL